MAKIFRQYESEIYGNYRKSYLIGGVLTGVAMSVISLIRDWLSVFPMSSPANLVTEIVLAVCICLSCYLYRCDLPYEKVSFKELMLLGLGIGVVSAIVYGVWVWLFCHQIAPSMVDYYNEKRIAMMEPAETSAAAKEAVERVSHYTAVTWAFIGCFRSAVASIIIAFFAALIFRTEKGKVKIKNKNA